MHDVMSIHVTVYEVMPIGVKTIQCENYHSAIILPELNLVANRRHHMIILNVI